MSESPYCFVIDASVPLAEAEMSLQLAMIALEGLYGQAGIRLEARYDVDGAGRAIVVDASTDVGAALVRVFTALLIREIGDDSFSVRRGTGPRATPPAGSIAAPVEQVPAGAAA
jgi:hypothetical protein